MVKLVICAIRLNPKTGRAINSSRNCFKVEAATLQEAQEIINKNSQGMRIESCVSRLTLEQAAESYKAEFGEISDMEYFEKIFNQEYEDCILWE